MIRRVVKICLTSLLLVTGNHSVRANEDQSSSAGVQSRKPEIADLVFPRESTSKLYFVAIACRFTDPDMQINFVVYPGGQVEIVRYSLAPEIRHHWQIASLRLLELDPTRQI